MHPRNLTRIVAFLSTALLWSAAWPQEPLQAVLDRGYVSRWLVCGPFEPDVDGGIVAAVQQGREPLGNLDFMAPIGRVARARPQHLLEVPRGDGKDPAIWQHASTESPALDLAPFFPEAEEGIAFAAVYLEAGPGEDVLMELNTPLGARLWLNGFPAIPIRAAPVASAGVDRMMLSLRAGRNLLLFEVPGATYDQLARAAGMDVPTLRTVGLRNRPLLEGRSGFEMAMKLYPVRSFGDLMYVPRLENTGAFSGVGSDVRQEVAMTFYNPGDRPSESIELAVKAPGVLESVTAAVPSIAPGALQRAQLAVPVVGAEPGQPLRLDVEMRRGETIARLNATVTVLSPTAGGSVYVISGAEDAETGGELDPRDRWVDRVRNELRLHEREPDFGFDLGPAIRWRAAYDLLPRQRDAIRKAISLNHVSAWPVFAALDERFASGEALVRNLAIGHGMSSALLNDWNPAAIAWDVPAIAPQTPQLLSLAEVDGVISNSPYVGHRPIETLLAPSGHKTFHRRKGASTPPATADELRRSAGDQRRELLDAGFPSDVLVNVSPGEPPATYWLGETAALRRTRPSVRVTGSGGRMFFREVEGALGRSAEPPIVHGRNLTTFEPGGIIAFASANEALAALQHRTLVAEKAATVAATLGAPYPEAWLDGAWRTTLALLQTNYAGVPKTARLGVDGLVALRGGLAMTEDLLARSLSYIASKANTYAGAPIRGENDRALVVFNPSGWMRSDVCVADVQLTQAAGITLLDGAGAQVPFEAERTRIVNGRLAQVRITFVARDVPAMGYKTYYIATQGTPPTATKREAVQIRNERFTISIDPQRGHRIVSVEDRDAGGNVADGRWNELLLLDASPEALAGGRELGSSTVRWRSTEASPTTTIEHAPGVERLVQVYATPYGDVKRTLALYAGIPTMHCSLEFGVEAREAGLWAVAFEGLGNRALRLGAAYGSVVAAPSASVLNLQTDGTNRPAGPAASPFLGWAAAGPDDGLRGGSGLAASFGPTVVVHGEGPAMRRMAERVVGALVARGVPAWSRSDAETPPPFGYTDSTRLPNRDDEFRHGAAMQILLGSPEQNLVSRVAFKQFDNDTVDRMTAALEGGGAWFFHDKTVDVPTPPPTVMLMGVSVGTTEREALRFVEEVTNAGIFHIPPAHWLSETEAIPTTGLAVVRKGAGLAVLDASGTLLMPVSQPARLENDDGGWSSAYDGPTFIEYGVLPYVNSWRDARVYRAGHERREPLASTTTDLHLAENSGEWGAFTLEDDSFVLTAFKPAGFRASAMRNGRSNPADGVIVRGYEASGSPLTARVTFPRRVVSAAEASLVERPGASIATAGEAVSFGVMGFGVSQVWVTPARGIRAVQGASIAPNFEDESPVYARSWRHGALAAPPMARPLTVMLEGRLDDPASQPRVVVANNWSEDEVSGDVTITASAGWSVAPARVSYSLRPGEYHEEELVVLRPATAESGGLVAQATVQGQSVFDVLALDASPFELTVERRGNEFRATVRNTSALPLEGALAAACAPSLWPELGAPVDVPLTPREARLFVPAYESRTITFVSPNGVPEYGVTFRASANGHSVYAAVAADQ